MLCVQATSLAIEESNIVVIDILILSFSFFLINIKHVSKLFSEKPRYFTITKKE